MQICFSRQNKLVKQDVAWRSATCHFGSVIAYWQFGQKKAKTSYFSSDFFAVFTLVFLLIFALKKPTFWYSRKKTPFSHQKNANFFKKNEDFLEKNGVFLCKNERFWKSDSYKGDFFAWKRPEKVDIFGKINRRFDEIKHRFIRAKRRLIFAKRHLIFFRTWKVITLFELSNKCLDNQLRQGTMPVSKKVVPLQQEKWIWEAPAPTGTLKKICSICSGGAFFVPF